MGVRKVIAASAVASAVLLGVVIAAPSANAAVIATKTSKGNCWAGTADQSSVTVTWQFDNIQRARAIKTSWGGLFGLNAVKVVTDQAKGGALVSGGRKTWTGAETTSGKYSYTMPWSDWTGSKLDVNVSIWEGNTAAADCHVRVPLPDTP